MNSVIILNCFLINYSYNDDYATGQKCGDKVMAAESVWDNSQKTVIRYVLDGDWSWHQFQNVLHVSRQEIRLLPHWVDVIVDMSTSNKLPPDTLANLRTVATHRTSNSGMIVIVGANPHAVSVYQA